MDQSRLNSIVTEAVRKQNDSSKRDAAVKDLRVLMSTADVDKYLSTSPSTAALVGLRDGLNAHYHKLKSTTVNEPVELKIGNWDAYKQAYV